MLHIKLLLSTYFLLLINVCGGFFLECHHFLFYFFKFVEHRKVGISSSILIPGVAYDISFWFYFFFSILF